jgi:signal transduction histidine kinase/ligand-binding sensor domain-containing protein
VRSSEARDREFFHRHRRIAGAVVFVFFTAICVCGYSQKREIRDVHHTAWTSENGPGAVFDVQQAPDGYLWLTTSKGVSRFDGVRFQSVGEVTRGAVNDNDIFSVFVSSSGGVWLSTRNAGLLLWRQQHLTVSHDRRCTPTAQFGGVVEGRDGSLWMQAAAGLAHLHGSVCELMGKKDGYPGGQPAGILVDRRGTVWVKAPSGELLSRSSEAARFEVVQDLSGPSGANAYLHEAPDGSIWISDGLGLRRFASDASRDLSARVKTPPDASPFGDFTFAADGTLWAVTHDGVERFKSAEHLPGSAKLDAASGESFTPSEGLSSNAIFKVIIDREGTVWVATTSGLDRLRHNAFTTVALPPSQEHQFAVAAGDDGAIWTGNISLPLTQVSADGKITSFQRLRRVDCIRRGRNGEIWAAGDGDFHLWRWSKSEFVPMHYPAEDTEQALSLAVDRNSQLWISARGGKVYHLAAGQWSRQDEALGKKPGVLGAMTDDDAGNVWFAFSNNLVRWDGQEYQRFSFPEGPLNISVSTMSVRDDHVWLAGRGGVVLFTHGRFHLVRWQDARLPGRVSGVVETRTGDLWVNGFSGVSHVPAAELKRWINDPDSSIVAEAYDALDGLPGLSAERIPEPSLVEAPNGRLWFATTKRIAWVDPSTLSAYHNSVPPPVWIDTVMANGKVYPDSDHVMLPMHIGSLRIDYTALSLAVPERVRFRYKLDGVDHDWQDSGTRRQAFYTNLSPGNYRFHVMASNNSGVWNEAGASFGFNVRAAFDQTPWFRLICALVVAAILWLLFRLRLMQVTRRIRERLAAQMAERERIARELHDTILQGFYGIILRFQTAADQVPSHEPAHQMIEDALDKAEGLLNQGRDSIRDLRGESGALMELSEEFAKLTEDYRSTTSASFRVEVQGTARAFHPVVRDEIYRIGHESIVNAFKHSHASKIEVELIYGGDAFVLRVFDNGRGIESEVVDAGGRAGHWGMIGMRERAKKIGAQLSVWSGPRAGTEIQLKIAARLAYQESPHRMRWFLRQRPTMADQ